MKKIYSFLLAVLSFLFFGCGQKAQPKPLFTIKTAAATEINAGYGWLNAGKRPSFTKR